MLRAKKLAASLCATGLLGLVAAAPVAAQPVVVVPGGLVTITVVDAVDVEDVNVQVPIGVAANVCDVTIAALAEVDEEGGVTDCRSQTLQDLPVAFQ